jgi:beta-lactamase class A
MIAAAAAEEPPQIVTPGAHEVSFGRIVSRVPKGTRRVVLFVDGKRVAVKAVRRPRVTIRYQLPRRDVNLRVVAVDGRGARTSSRRVGPVLGLPARAAPRRTGAFELAPLRRELARHTRGFSGTSAVYVRDLSTGLGASQNASASFPAGSTLKVALVLEALRTTSGPPPRNSELGRLLASTIAASSNLDANQLAVAIAGSTSAASARVNALMARIGLTGSDLFGGYIVEEAERAGRGLAGVPREPPRPPPPIPLETVEAPQFGRGKHTSAADLARLFSAIHLAAGGRGPLIKHHRGAITPAEARHLLFLLAHTSDRDAKLAAGVPGATVAHKAGWISTARHDAGIVYHKGGAFVIAVMTFNAGGVGAASDELAARAAQTTLRRLRR